MSQLVGLGGLEPPTSRLSGVRSNHLSYAPKLKTWYKEQSSKRVTRIELATTAWKAVVLPLNYTRMAVPTGFEPAISCVTGRHVNHYTTEPFWKWRLTGSNRWPSACKADALPAELNSQMSLVSTRLNLLLSDYLISQGATPNYFRRSRA